MLALKPLNRPVLFAVTTLLALCSLCQTPEAAFALPFHSKKKAADNAAAKLQTYQPPPVDSIRTRCEPYRLTVVQNNNRFLLAKPFYTPQSLYSMTKYKKCIDDVMDQEYLYLKHAEIESPTKLPKMAMPLDPDSNNSSADPSTTPQPPIAPLTSGQSSTSPTNTMMEPYKPNPAQLNPATAPPEIVKWKLAKPESEKQEKFVK